MKKLLLRTTCLLCALLMLSCTESVSETSAEPNTTAAEETVPQTDAEEPVVDNWTPPTYKELVDRLMAEGKVVADFVRDKGFKYGDAEINPAINWRTLDTATAINSKERIVACDRLVGWILFRAGFIDQDFRHGLDLYRYFEEHDFELIESVRSVRAGDIVFVNPDKNGNPGHVFLCAGTNKRYDGGSDARINGSLGPQPFTESITNFVRAYRPNPAKMPNPSMLELYEAPESTAAVIAENSTVLFEQESANGTFSTKKQYAHGEEYKQYEFHLTLRSVGKGNSNTETNAAFVGLRLPERRSTARQEGGIYVSFNGANKACLFFGKGGDRYSWNYKPAYFTIPEDFSTAHKLVVVDANDVIKFYMYKENGEEYMLCSIRVSDQYDQAVVKDHDGKIVYSGSAVISNSGYYGVWAYNADVTATDISIKAS
ncbi:MAG: hypothetical protein IKT65_04340 [Clostridia bacterium]|nr:hypothetical protein [Clostridia bacterium]